jgi:hypothetical protein
MTSALNQRMLPYSLRIKVVRRIWLRAQSLPKDKRAKALKRAQALTALGRSPLARNQSSVTAAPPSLTPRT